MDYRRLFKSKIFIFTFSFIIEMALYYGVNAYVFHDQYFSLDLGFLPVLGLLLGPYSALGFASAALMSDLIFEFSYYGIVNGVFDLTTYMVIGVLTWRLWYDFKIGNHVNKPKFDSAGSIFKAILIILAVGFYNLLITVYIYGMQDYAIQRIFCTFALPLTIVLILVPLFNYYRVPLYVPKKQFKKRFSLKIYNLMFLLMYVPTLIGAVFNLKLSIPIIAMSYICCIVFLLKPFKEESLNVDEDYTTTLNERLINSMIKLFLMVLVIVLTIAFINDFSFDLDNIKGNIEFIFWINLMLVTSYMLFLIPLTVYLKYVERNIIEPISEISNIAVKVNELKGLDDIKNEFSKINNKNELGILSESLMDLTSTIEEYSDSLKENISRKERYETELKLANEIQTSMIPTDFDEFTRGKDIEIYGLMNPAYDVGGDFYDYLDIDGDSIGFVIGDVSGKGIPAALFMIKTMTLVKDYLKHYNDLKLTFSKVNNGLCLNNNEEYFVTSWLAKFDLSSGDLSFVNAGHNQPLVCIGGEVRYLDTKPGLVLAAMEDIPYRENSIRLSKGDFIVLYTDGVTEANNNYEGFYGEDRLKHVVEMNKDKHPKEIIRAIKEDVADYTDNAEQFDDTTLLILKYV
ncbi:MAG: PP2C family protein-serine/threonine phosphatase [Methanobrevibacter sp.]